MEWVKISTLTSMSLCLRNDARQRWDTVAVDS